MPAGLPSRPVRGLIDTGSSCCVITADNAARWGLILRTSGKLITAHGIVRTKIHLATLTFHVSGEKGTFRGVEFATSDLADPNYDIIIGRNIIELGALSISGGEFEFRLPNDCPTPIP